MPQKKIHILTQYVWPDSAPTGILAEQLADRLLVTFGSTVIVTGSGRYRESERPAPSTPIIRLTHFRGQRGSHISTAREYFSVTNAFKRYIAKQVKAGDVVVVTSAPPNTIRMIHGIQQADGIGIYWLQDYYPELFRTIIDPPAPFRWVFGRSWDRWLRKWHHVVKAAGNLGYSGSNSSIIRNWPTISGERRRSTSSGTPPIALYTGNLGYCHDIDCFIDACRTLHLNGYQIVVRGDGPGISRLPDWIQTGPSFPSEEHLVEALESAEVHLVAGHPKYQLAVFPSKFWNSRLIGKRMVEIGFEGALREELNESKKANFSTHLDQWVDLMGQFLPKKRDL